MYFRDTTLGTILIISLAVLSQIIFCAVVVRNVVIHKSLVGWLFPDGTTKTEKTLLLVTLAIIISIIIFGPFSGE